MVNCNICNAKMDSLFLGKIKGTYLKGKGKLYKVCSDCQKKYTINELKKKLKIE